MDFIWLSNHRSTDVIIGLDWGAWISSAVKRKTNDTVLSVVGIGYLLYRCIKFYVKFSPEAGYLIDRNLSVKRFFKVK